MRDPNTGFLFNLQPLASGKGYMTTGIGRRFLVRILTVQSVAYGCCCCIFPVLVSKWNFNSVLLGNLSWRESTVLDGRNER